MKRELNVNTKPLGSSEEAKIGKVGKDSGVETALKRALMKIEKLNNQSSFYGDKIMIIESNNAR